MRDLYLLFCSFPDCARYAKYEVGIDGPMVCRRHARQLKCRDRILHMAKLMENGDN